MDTKNSIAAHLGPDFAAAFLRAMRQVAQVNEVEMQRASDRRRGRVLCWLSHEGEFENTRLADRTGPFRWGRLTGEDDIHHG